MDKSKRHWLKLEKFIKWKNPKPGTMYGKTKTHKESNPPRTITSGSRTIAKNVSIFVEKFLFPQGLKTGAVHTQNIW